MCSSLSCGSIHSPDAIPAIGFTDASCSNAPPVGALARESRVAPRQENHARMTTVSLIGAPTDVGASVRGAGMGPDALRVAGIAEALAAHRFDVIDRGNLAGPPNPWNAPVQG